MRATLTCDILAHVRLFAILIPTNASPYECEYIAGTSETMTKTSHRPFETRYHAAAARRRRRRRAVTYLDTPLDWRKQG